MYWFVALSSLAGTLIAVFEPVFFYKEGFSLAMIAVYYGLHYTAYFLLIPLGGKFASRYGLERSLAISIPIFVFYFLLLAAMPNMHRLFWLSWAVLAVFKIFFWPAYHATFARFGDSHNRGTEVSFSFVLRVAIGVVGPLVGGIVATRFGFPVLFLITAGIALTSVFSLLRTRERLHMQTFDYSAPWRIVKSRLHRGLVMSSAAWGGDLIHTVFWPIFIYIILGNAEQLGYLVSFSALTISVLIFFMGEMSDRYSRRLLVRLHVPFMVLGFLFRPLAVSPVRLVLTELLVGASGAGVVIPFLVHIYGEGKRVGTLRYLVAFEMVLAIAKALVAFAAAIIFMQLLPFTAFTAVFGLAALFTLLYLFI